MYNNNNNNSTRLYYEDIDGHIIEDDWDIIARLGKIRLNFTIPERFDGISCIDCQEEIPQPRLELNTYRCIDCQLKFEKNIDG